jgi:hypothetical protein
MGAHSDGTASEHGRPSRLMGARAGDLSARRTAESEAAAAAAAAEALRLKGDDVDLNRLDKVRNSCLTAS